MLYGSKKLHSIAFKLVVTKFWEEILAAILFLVNMGRVQPLSQGRLGTIFFKTKAVNI